MLPSPQLVLHILPAPFATLIKMILKSMFLLWFKYDCHESDLTFQNLPAHVTVLSTYLT